MKSSASPARSSSSFSRLRICACTETSSAETASSQMSSRGAGASARAMATRCCSPPDSPRACAWRTRRAARSCRAARGRRCVARPPARSASDSAAPIVMAGFSADVGSWKTIWARRAGGRSLDQSMVPLSCLSSPTRHRGQGRLARPGLADDADRLAGADGDGDVVERWRSGRAEPLGDVARARPAAPATLRVGANSGTESRRDVAGAERVPAGDLRRRHPPAGGSSVRH